MQETFDREKFSLYNNLNRNICNISSIEERYHGLIRDKKSKA